MNSEYFMDELTSSLNHMEETQATRTLLITGWGLENPHARKCHEDFCQHNKKRLQECKIIVMSVKSLAQVSARLAAEPKLLGRKNLSSSKDMVAIFRALEVAMDSGEQDLGKVWFDEAMERMQAEPPSPEPPEPDPEPDPEPGPGPGPGM